MITLMNGNYRDKHQKQLVVIYGLGFNQKLNTKEKLFNIYGITMLLIITSV